jgi:SAM-dependent methyltransferase
MHLVDPVAVHVEAARTLSDREPPALRLGSAERGDALALPWHDRSLDGCLVFGPMYHLTARVERVKALAEVRRVLRPRGVLLATAISRFASIRGGLEWGLLGDAEFRVIAARDLASGQHRNPSRDPRWFTTAYYHRPEELAHELEEAGFAIETLVGVDGAAGFLHNLDWWLDDESRREVLLEAVRSVESESSLLGASPQLMIIGTTPDHGCTGAAAPRFPA